MNEIKDNIAVVTQTIRDYEHKYHRDIGCVKLLAASKEQSVAKITEAYRAGIQRFGENYLQEALEKIEALKDMPIEWHFIGQIQSNKTRKIAEHFTWVQSLSDEKIALRLSAQRPAHLPPLNVSIEVHVDSNDNKSGVLPEAVRALATYCQQLPRLKLRGLMSIPDLGANFEKQRETFHTLSMLYEQLRADGFEFDTLSIGMTEDYEAAIAEGSTLVRIGRAIFGERT